MNSVTALQLMKSSLLLGVFSIAATNTGAQNASKWKQTSRGVINTITNPGGATLGYFSGSGVKVLTVNGLAFKDLNKNGKLDPYEDWRLPVDARAKDLAGKMSVQQIAG
ncbi:MAG TPA: hypothetical protein VFT06_07825, partial [Flavisolibacter sp.]|nr:hypothetical protein [Flavisolibacter sp.]